jgi:hypothetical protein
VRAAGRMPARRDGPAGRRGPGRRAGRPRAPAVVAGGRPPAPAGPRGCGVSAGGCAGPGGRADPPPRSAACAGPDAPGRRVAAAGRGILIACVTLVVSGFADRATGRRRGVCDGGHRRPLRRSGPTVPGQYRTFPGVFNCVIRRSRTLPHAAPGRPGGGVRDLIYELRFALCRSPSSLRKSVRNGTEIRFRAVGHSVSRAVERGTRPHTHTPGQSSDGPVNLLGDSRESKAAAVTYMSKL